jgi:hypothetical protein
MRMAVAVASVVASGCLSCGNVRLFEDAGVALDAGEEVDGGVACEPLPQIADGNPLGGPADALVGQPVTFFSSFVEIPHQCVAAVASGPGGAQAQVSVGGADGDTIFTFIPTVTGPWQLSLTSTSDGGATYAIDTSVVEPAALATACLQLSRPCARFSEVPGAFGCDEVLFDEHGLTLSTLDGGVWLGEGDALFGWVDGVLHGARVSNGAVSLLAGQPAARPELWAAGAGRLVVVAADAGVSVWALDAGVPGARVPFPEVSRPRAARVSAEGAVTVLGSSVCTEAGCGAEVLQVYAASAEQLLYAVFSYQGQELSNVTDAGTSWNQTNAEWLAGPNRRALTRSVNGWYLVDTSLVRVGAPMRAVSGSTAHHVWASSDAGTDVYCQ